MKTLATTGAALLCAAAVALPAAALGSTRHTTSNSQNYPDSIGENPNAPDITSIDVSNDNAGNITFKVNISNRPTFTPDMLFFVYLNTDDKASTGDPQAMGSDYVIEVVPNSPAGPGAANLFQWNGSDFVAAPSQTSLTYVYAATGPTIHINANELGNTRTLGFAVTAISGVTYDASDNPVVTNIQQDNAPDPGHGLYSYRVIVKVTLKQTGFVTAPDPARAGNRFSASLGVSESDTSGPVQKATVTCSATVAGKRLPATHSLANGVASCYWKLPKPAKGKILHGTVTVAAQGATLTKSFAVRVR